MKKHLKYLISFLLVFGLTVNDCLLYSQSKSQAYYQYSNVIISKELNHSNSKLYVFNQKNSSEKTGSAILLSYFQFQDSLTLQIPVLIKSQTQLYQKVRSITTQHIFLKELITSKNALTPLYIA